MKKILAAAMCSLVVGCGDFNLFNSTSNSSSNENNPAQTGTPFYAENGLSEGNNTLNYDTTKSFNTLTYYAQTPATNEYTKSVTYTISKDNQVAEPSAKIALNSKTAIQEKSAKELINELNREIQQYGYDNNINPAQKNDLALYKTMPAVVDNNTKWENVHVLNIDNGTYKTINATCIAVSKYAYFFLEDGLAPISADKMQEVVTAFDKDYEIMHQYYGEETDTDGNGKVSFLISNFKEGIMGFFYTADKYKQQNLLPIYKSNEADVLYVNYFYFDDKQWPARKTDVLATFIHEFQHMVLFDTRSRNKLNPSLSTWINEGLSMLSEYYGGYGSAHYNYISYYLMNNQGKSLITDDSSQDYGFSYLFMRYLQIRFGDVIVKNIYNSKYTGIESIEEATGVDFNTLFLDFAKMMFITGRGVSTDPRYDIADFNCVEGTECYNKNGFNLANLIDTTYSSHYAANPIFITQNGYQNQKLEMYSFVITKWSSKPNTINLTSSDTTGISGVAGIYSAW